MTPKYRQSVPRGQQESVRSGGEQAGSDAGPIPFLGIIDGPTGAGKSAALEHLLRRHSASCVVGAKLTTRPRRASDGDWELRFVDEIPASLREFTYSSVGWHYAVDVANVEHALGTGLSYFTICTDPAVTRALVRRFPTVVIYVHRLLSPRGVSALLAARRTTGREDTRLRAAEVVEAVGRYTRNIGLYDFVVLNVGGVSDLHNQVDAIVAECALRSRVAGEAPFAPGLRGEEG